MRHAKSSSALNSVSDAEALFGGKNKTSETIGEHAFIDFLDSGAAGNYNVNFPFPNPAARGDDFAILATAKIYVFQRGTITFGFNTDDGGRLRIDGNTVAEFPGLRVPGNSLGSVELERGYHDVEFLMFERGVGAEAELFVAREYGEISEFAPGKFRLLPASPPPPGPSLVTKGGRWRVTSAKSSTPISTSEDAAALLGGRNRINELASTHRAINFSEPDAGGHFASDEAFPHLAAGGDDFAFVARGTIAVKEPGRVTFGVRADQGGRLSIDGKVIAETSAKPDAWNRALADDKPDVWWQFNQGDAAAAVLNHGTSAGHVGTASGATLGRAGIFGAAEAAEFDGTKGNRISSNDAQRITGDATAEYILLGRDVGTAQALHTEDSANNNVSLRFEQWNNTGQLGFTRYRVADYQFTPANGAAVTSPFDRWTHLVFVRNAAGPTFMSVYVDGRLAGTSTVNIDIPVAHLGATGAGTDAFSGLIDESALYRRALTPDQIAEHFRAFDQVRPGGTILGSVELTAGPHEVEFLAWERDGSASAELFVANKVGTFNSFEPGLFELLEPAALPTAESGVTFKVANANPAGDGSLRAAIESLNGQADDGRLHVIDLSSLEGTIVLDEPLPWIERSVIFQGPGANRLAISGNRAHQVFFADRGDVEFRDVTIRDGLAKGGDGGGGAGGMGGGLFVNEGASARVSGVTFANNIAQGGNGQIGAGGPGGSSFGAVSGSDGKAGFTNPTPGANASGLRDGVNGRHGGAGANGGPAERGADGPAFGSGGGHGSAGGGGRSGGNGANGRNARSVTGFLGIHDHFDVAGDGGNGGKAGNGGLPSDGGHGNFGGGGGSGGQGGQAGEKGGSPGQGGSGASALVPNFLGGAPVIVTTPAGSDGSPGGGGTHTNGGRGGNGGYAGGAAGGGLGFLAKGTSHGPDGVPIAYGGFAAGQSGGGGGAGLGGAVFVRAGGSLTLSNTRFQGNMAQGGTGGGMAEPGQGKGGAIFAMHGATVKLETVPDLLDNAASTLGATEGDNEHFYNVDFPAPGYANFTFHQDVREQVYYLEGDDAAEKSAAALRYIELLYKRFPDGARAQFELMDPSSPNTDSQLYGPGERFKIEQQLSAVEKALALDPNNLAWQQLWLDIHYDRATAEAVIAKQLLAKTDRIRFNPPQDGAQPNLDPLSATLKFVIEDEIRAHETALAQNRLAFDGFFALLGKDIALPGQRPFGYEVFRTFVPARPLRPATYLDNDGNPQPVASNGAALFGGYKDFILLFDLLRTQGRAALGLVELYLRRNQPPGGAPDNLPGDRERALKLIGGTQRFLLLHRDILRQIFPALPLDRSDSSGLAETVAGLDQTLSDLTTMRQAIEGGQNPLGFKRDFLMLVSNRAGSFDSFDNLKAELNPADAVNSLGWALATWDAAQSSIDTAGRLEDELKTEFQNTASTSRNRLSDIVGVRPGEPGYTTPETNVGSDIWQQLQSVETAKLRVQRNRVEIDSLKSKVRIEVDRRGKELGINNAISSVKIKYINQRADLTETMGHIEASQKALDNFAEIFSFEKLIKGAVIAGVVNGLAQAGLEEWKGQLEVQKERLAADEQAEITSLENDLITANSEAQIKTWLLEMDTLLLDSQEAAILLAQEVGRLMALYGEKAELERRIAEANVDLGSRYFADPVHRLREGNDKLQANLAFEDAQKWLFFMARALEYKWNVPLQYPSPSDPRWTLDTLFKLRNAQELRLIYIAMSNFDRELGQPQNKGSFRTWFSLREDFFGYFETDLPTGQPLLYADPANPSGAALSAKAAFRRELQLALVDLLKPENNAIDFANPQKNPFVDLELEFNTVRQKDNFFVGPVLRIVGNSSEPVAGKEGAFLDKIQRMRVRIPGTHSTSAAQAAGNLSYGGTSFIRNWDPGRVTDLSRPDQLRNEMTAYSTRFWFRHPDGDWRFTAAMNQRVTIELTGPNPGQGAPAPDSIFDFDTFKERSVAATGWKLNIEVISDGAVKLKLNEIDDIELFFFHEAYTRQSRR